MQGCPNKQMALSFNQQNNFSFLLLQVIIIIADVHNLEILSVQEYLIVHYQKENLRLEKSVVILPLLFLC